LRYGGANRQNKVIAGCHSEPKKRRDAEQIANFPAKISRADQIRREMEEWRRKNPDKDFGREM
jgi:hypothetical protein